MTKKKRAPGTGTVQFHEGRYRLRLPPSLDPKRRWQKRTFPADEEERAHQMMDFMVQQGRKMKASITFEEGLSLYALWGRYVASETAKSTRSRGAHAGTKTRARLEGMAENWLSKAPFWKRDMAAVTSSEVVAWMSEVRMSWKNAKGERVSSSWINQMGSAVRAAFALAGFSLDAMLIESDRSRATALNLNKQQRFFQLVLTTPLDRVMAGCQMGAGLRVGELLSLQADRVHVDSDPHLEITTGGPNGAPTKSGRPRRVELLEPGLGFFRMALQHHHRPNPKGLLFCGPQGGYLSGWPEQFVKWRELMGERLTSHVMRHTWAYSMLSGLWGYAPQDITFVSRQLGHADIKTTQEAYGHWDPGAGLATAKRLRGEISSVERVVTAERLLGQDSGDIPSLPPSLSYPRNRFEMPNWVSDGNSQEPGSGEQEAEILGQDLAHEDVFEAALDLHRARTAGRLGRLEAERFLLALGDDIRALSPLLALRGGDPRAVTMTLHLATQVVREMPQLEKEVM